MDAYSGKNELSKCMLVFIFRQNESQWTTTWLHHFFRRRDSVDRQPYQTRIENVHWSSFEVYI
jgi:hypothetical protein